MNKIVSILIPVYNVEPYLRQCLDSIVNQTYKNLQVVIIDDGSKDGSPAICDEYADKYNFVEVYHQENCGVAETRNRLLLKIKGDYVLFVDSDDWIELDTVEYVVNKISASSCDIVTFDVVKDVQEVKTTDVKEEMLSQENVIKEFLRHVSFNGSLWNKFFKSNVLKKKRFEMGISYGEDALMTWNVLQEVKNVLVTDKQLYHYRMNETSISHQTYGEKKMSGHKVWTKIVADTICLWPQYIDIARARFALEDMWQLYFASLSGYKFDENIHIFQINIRRNIGIIIKSNLASNSKIFFAILISYCYGIGALAMIYKRLTE